MMASITPNTAEADYLLLDPLIVDRGAPFVGWFEWRAAGHKIYWKGGGSGAAHPLEVKNRSELNVVRNTSPPKGVTDSDTHVSVPRKRRPIPPAPLLAAPVAQVSKGRNRRPIRGESQGKNRSA